MPEWEDKVGFWEPGNVLFLDLGIGDLSGLPV